MGGSRLLAGVGSWQFRAVAERGLNGKCVSELISKGHQLRRLQTVVWQRSFTKLPTLQMQSLQFLPYSIRTAAATDTTDDASRTASASSTTTATQTATTATVATTSWAASMAAPAPCALRQ